MEEEKEFFFTDTHAHLSSSRFEEDLDEVVARASEAEVGRIISISCDLEDSRTNLELAARFDTVLPTSGTHPLYVHELEGENWLHELHGLASNPATVGLGEIGLDYFHAPPEQHDEESWRRLQRDVFEAQLQLALDLDLPVVIHQRNSAPDVSAVLDNFPQVRAVLHCFTGTVAEAEAALERGNYLSFTGILTFPNAAEVREVAGMVPPDRVMIETDCPYLAPKPFRGMRCEPAHVVHVAETLAGLHGRSLEEMARITSANALAFFRKGTNCAPLESAGGVSD